MDRQTLRKNRNTRNDFYFYQGLDRLNKECDMAYIIKQIRIMRYFLKTVLSKDQRVLLKLKGSENIPSENEKPNPLLFKKTLNKTLLLDRYLEAVQQKEINVEDERLFKVLGQSDTYQILKEQKKRQKENQLDSVIKSFIERSNQRRPAEEWTEKVIRRVNQLGTS